MQQYEQHHPGVTDEHLLFLLIQHNSKIHAKTDASDSVFSPSPSDYPSCFLGEGRGSEVNCRPTGMHYHYIINRMLHRTFLKHTGLVKNRSHSIFSRISKKGTKDRRFLHVSRLKTGVYTEHVYKVRVYSFYYMKWRHLVNRLGLQLDNAALKLQHHGVSQRLAHSQDEH